MRTSVLLIASAATLLGVFAAGVLVGRTSQDPSPPTAGLPAFPGAMGFGAATPGGRGGRVLSVTNLHDSGPGSLRAALESTGRRTVVFRVAGTITLNSRLVVDNPYLTIAGQSAPGEGVTVRIAPDVPEQALKIETHDVVVRYLRVRPGPDADEGEDALTIAGGDAHDIIVDHCSFSWAVDEVVNTYSESRNITIQNSIISEALSLANHEKGEHSKGLLAGGHGSKDVSILRNLFVSNVDRNPQVSGVSVADIRNNVVYNYGDGAGLGVTLVSSSKGEPEVNWVGNFYKPGPDSDAERVEFATYDGDTGATHGFYAADNKRWTPSGVLEARVSADAVGRRDTPFTVPLTRTMAAGAAYRHVLADAGASRNRDSVDERIVQEVRNGTGSIIDHPDEVGGWPALDPGQTYADPDGDGMPSAWERSHGLDPFIPNASGDVDGDGWTNIEEFLDGRARPHISATSKG